MDGVPCTVCARPGGRASTDGPGALGGLPYLELFEGPDWVLPGFLDTSGVLSRRANPDANDDDVETNTPLLGADG